MPLAHLPAVVAELDAVARAFEAAGRRVFLVGGVVRDLWLDASLGAAADIDLTTDAIPEETKELVGPLADALWTQGERFGTIGCRIGGRDIEITTHRSESYVASSRKPKVEFAEQIEADLSRRDFTVNAMAIELPAGQLVDPFHGAADLGAGVLRTPIGARASFTDDPLRMLRAARFSAGYRLSPTDEVVAAMIELANRLDIVAIERVGDEIDKLVTLDAPGDGFLLLEATGVLARVFPGVAARLGRGDHAALHAFGPIPTHDLLGRWVVLAWFDGDQTAESVRSFSARLRLSKARTQTISTVVEHVSRLGSVSEGSVADVRRWALSAGEHRERVLRFGLVVDHDATHPVRARLEELERTEDLDDPGVPVDGAEIMRLLDLEAGPHIGELLERLRHLRYEQGPLTRAEALEALNDD